MVIDFRVRAPFEHYAKSPLYEHLDIVEKDTLSRTDAGSPLSAKKRSLQLLLQEADEAGIDKLVIPVRRALGNGNEAVGALVSQYPSRLVALAGIDITDIDLARLEIEQHVLRGPCKGIVLEPGQDSTPWQANSTWIFPLYDYCAEHNVPIAFTYGGIMTRSLRCYDPMAIDDIAGAFPRLKIALCHGGWPHVAEVCQIALNHGNVWLAPDIYMVRSPGMFDYAMAANHILRHRFIFASAYPILPLKEARQAYEEQLVPAAKNAVFGENAMEFLSL